MCTFFGPWSRIRRHASFFALGLLNILLTLQGAAAQTVWAPMWDMRFTPMTWEFKASGDSVTSSYFSDGFAFASVTSNAAVTPLSGGGDQTTPSLPTTPGEIYTMTFGGGFHVRPHWEGVEWARLGQGIQAAGPGSNVGFPSDAELGFDSRWANLPSHFADTTWYFQVADGERLSVSVEEIVGDTRDGRTFEFISPSGVVTTADADGLPGSGVNHYPARGGSLANPPDPTSAFWDEYTAPTSEAGWWGFKLNAVDGVGTPYAWHYILDRTDSGEDQHAYLRPDSILDPMKPIVNSDVMQIALGESVTYTFTASDPDNGPQPLTWTLEGMTGGPALVPVFDPATQLFTWNSTGSAPGVYVATAGAFDGDLKGLGTLTITVVPEPWMGLQIAVAAAGWLVAWQRPYSRRA